jgi:GH15 family glucan-1,4-alpha-glucosidase
VAGRIEDYAIIGDMQTAALVCSDGSIDWLCRPRFDAGACFAALLGSEQNGFWRIAPSGLGDDGVSGRSRRLRRLRSLRSYRGDTLVLETRWETADGAVRVIDFMPHYGATELDAAVLLIPELGFLPGDDPRVVSGAETRTHRSAA